MEKIKQEKRTEGQKDGRSGGYLRHGRWERNFYRCDGWADISVVVGTSLVKIWAVKWGGEGEEQVQKLWAVIELDVYEGQ